MLDARLDGPTVWVACIDSACVIPARPVVVRMEKAGGYAEHSLGSPGTKVVRPPYWPISIRNVKAGWALTFGL